MCFGMSTAMGQTHHSASLPLLFTVESNWKLIERESRMAYSKIPGRKETGNMARVIWLNQNLQQGNSHAVAESKHENNEA